MSISNSIRLSLNIKDPNIHFSENCVHEEVIHSSLALIYSATLSASPPDVCPICGTINESHSIIKNGSKLVNIKLPRVSNRTTILRLKKQRFLCRSCLHSFSLHSDICKPNHSISTHTFHASLLDLKKKLSIKDIAHRHDISHTTLNNWLHSLHDQFVTPKTSLPLHLCFDEFKSVKTISAKMSFLFTDAVSGHVIDIVSNRQLSHLRSYFRTYSTNARKQVKTICIDMYSPYIELIKDCFPHAAIISDRFHVIQLISRSLNATRTKVMREHPTSYRKLKRYWKLFLKDASKLNTTDYRYFRCFPHKMSEKSVVLELLRIDSELEETYWFYQHYLMHFKQKNMHACRELIHHASSNLSTSMKTTIKTLKKHDNYIENALLYPYSNGVIEGTNNLIKVIKRIAFGYRSYENFRARILLITNTLVRLELN